MDWVRGYGRTQKCCSQECYEEFEWRNILSIFGKDYYPNPKTQKASDEDM